MSHNTQLPNRSVQNSLGVCSSQYARQKLILVCSGGGRKRSSWLPACALNCTAQSLSLSGQNNVQSISDILHVYGRLGPGMCVSYCDFRTLSECWLISVGDGQVGCVGHVMSSCRAVVDDVGDRALPDRSVFWSPDELYWALPWFAQALQTL